MKDASADKLKGLITWVYSKEKLPKILKITSHALVLISICAFFALLLVAYSVSFVNSIKLAVICVVPFVILSIFRHLLNAPRPYEVYDVFESLPKNKLGRSFPSRHVFSAFLIATLAIWVHPALGFILIALAIALSFVRVMLGIHFPRDCIAGGVLGVLSAIIGVLVAPPFV